MIKEQKEIITKFRQQGASYSDIGKIIGATKEAFRGFCRRNNIDKKDNVKSDILKFDICCRECGKPIEHKPNRKKYSAANPVVKNGGLLICNRLIIRRYMNLFV